MSTWKRQHEQEMSCANHAHRTLQNEASGEHPGRVGCDVWPWRRPSLPQPPSTRSEATLVYYSLLFPCLQRGIFKFHIFIQSISIDSGSKFLKSPVPFGEKGPVFWEGSCQSNILDPAFLDAGYNMHGRHLWSPSPGHGIVLNS